MLYLVLSMMDYLGRKKMIEAIHELKRSAIIMRKEMVTIKIKKENSVINNDIINNNNHVYSITKLHTYLLQSASSPPSNISVSLSAVPLPNVIMILIMFSNISQTFPSSN